ncbi:glutamate synthase subunit beta [Marinicella meishanensis]|uniref:glutamate synthase subunit beta n=1 Tax=Marinicella meishanensis TaxID=2873263 RepID=UPI001CBAE847|nr:glutamate synthase subunit beta [Marinicella sp. NBU2979]
MGKVTGFMEYSRITEPQQKVAERIRHFQEFTQPLSLPEWQQQGARCMNCGIPFCHSGCPLGNLIPDFNEAVYQGQWHKASQILHQTNNFPEFTGRLCPAPCEEACVLNIQDAPVSIEHIEKNIAERAFAQQWIKPQKPAVRSGHRVAVIGSGPAGLAAAEQLNLAGHHVTVFEQDARIGGLLRYGIPDFKLDKSVIDRRLHLMQAAGIEFRPQTQVGRDLSAAQLRSQFAATALCVGANQPRELPIPGCELQGVHQAMCFLSHNNRLVSGEREADPALMATDKCVIVIGGGDTGSDCLGTAVRQQAASVVNLEIMPQPPAQRPAHQPWPYWPMRLRPSSSHQEAGEPNWAITTQAFLGDEQGHLRALRTVAVKWQNKQGQMTCEEVPGTEQEWPCDMVLLAMGFTGTQAALATALGLSRNARDLLAVNANSHALDDHFYAAGDCRRGQSLIVWAIAEGRELARQIDLDLMGSTRLPSKGPGDLPPP